MTNLQPLSKEDRVHLNRQLDAIPVTGEIPAVHELRRALLTIDELEKEQTRLKFELAEADFGFGGWASTKNRLIREKNTLCLEVDTLTQQEDFWESRVRELESRQKKLVEALKKSNFALSQAIRKWERESGSAPESWENAEVLAREALREIGKGDADDRR